MDPTIFQAHPEIIQKVFDALRALDVSTFLNCILVCKSWNLFLENPKVWLKQLREVGLPTEIETAWKALIEKSKDFKIEKRVFAKCLRMKFLKFIHEQQSCDDSNEFSYRKNVAILEKCPPLYTAASVGSIEIVKLIYQLGEDYNRKIELEDSDDFVSPRFVMPIFAAIENGHTEVAKFFLNTPQETMSPSLNQHRENPLQVALINKNLDLVKFLFPRITNANWTFSPSLIHLAARDYAILKYVMSQPGVDPDLKNGDRHTALQMLSDYSRTSYMKIPPGDIAKMIRILAPLANKEELYSGYCKSPLHIAADSGNVEALKALLEFFDANKKDWFGLPIDAAIPNLHIECVRILAPLTKELKIDEKFNTSTRKMSDVLNVLQSVIDERKRSYKLMFGVGRFFST